MRCLYCKDEMTCIDEREFEAVHVCDCGAVAHEDCYSTHFRSGLRDAQNVVVKPRELEVGAVLWPEEVYS
jgi:hypothetical protein